MTQASAPTAPQGATRALVLASALLAALPALAQISIEVGAQHEGAWSDGRTFAPPATMAWGWATASTAGTIGDFGTGTAPCDTIICPPGPSVPGGEAGAVARADTSQMNLGVRAWGAGGFAAANGVAEVEVTDFLVSSSFQTVEFDIHLDLAHAVSALPGSEGRYRFAVALGSGDDVSTLFSFLAERRFTSSGVFETTAQVLANDGATFIDLGSIPSTYEYTLLASLVPGNTRILIAASAEADAPIDALSFVNVNAYNSAWLGIRGDVASANGYAYPGASPIPEPHAWALMALGLGIVSLRRMVARRAR